MRAALSRLVASRPRRLCCVALVAAGLSVAGMAESTWGQTKKKNIDTQKRSGKISAIVKKGKAADVTVEQEDGDKLEVKVTTKMEFVVTGKGDATFFRPRNMASAEAIMSPQRQLIAREFTVYLGPKQPGASVQRDPNAMDVYRICGEIGDADKESVTLNLGGEFGVQKVLFESSLTPLVNVSSSDADHAPEGAEVEVEGTERAGKFLPSKVTVSLSEPMKADEVFGSKEKTKAGSKTASKTKSKSTTKSKDDSPTGASVGDATDPFGLKKKAPAKNEKK